MNFLLPAVKRANLSRPEPEHNTRYHKVYIMLYGFALLLIATGFCLDNPSAIIQGLCRIVYTESALITDYIALAGAGAALVNAGIVTFCSVALLRIVKEPANGMTVVAISLMSGFSLFGKNFVNIWPILFGTFLYAQIQNEPFRKYAILGLTTTALAPIVSFIALNDSYGNVWLAITVGILIGIIVTPLSTYTFQIQNGMNLYNTGFACGLIAMMLVPLMEKMGANPDTFLYWSTGQNTLFSRLLFGLCFLLIAFGFLAFPLPTWAVWAGYRRLLQTSGRSPSDYLRMFGPAPVLVNTGVNGILATVAVLMIEGDLNGATIGAILTIMGFSSFGKHALNIIPVMIGVAISTMAGQWGFSSMAQLSLLFGTTLAPIAGYFGWMYGVIAGIFHAAVVLSTSSPVGGLNLYNNGFSGGLVAIFLYPIILAVIRRRKAEVQDEDYFDVVEHDEPITPPKHHEIKEKAISQMDENFEDDSFF